MQCYKNAKQIQSIDLQDRAFHYGDGCFSTIRIRNSNIELKQRHLIRLKTACQQLNLAITLDEINDILEKSLVQIQVHDLSQEIDDAQKNVAALNGTLKVIISRGIGNRGYSSPEQKADMLVYYYPNHRVQEHAIEYIDCGVLTHQIGLTMPHLVGLKTLNRLEQVILKQEADQKKYTEALVLDVHQHIVEGIASNCFIFMNNKWFTPELRYNGVHGVMRAEILERMQQHHIPVSQSTIEQHQIKEIDALFFCNALSAMRVVANLNDIALNTQPCIDLFHRLDLNKMN